jgi:hypothetical protein
MSKWLRRGFGQTNSLTQNNDERQPPQSTEFPSPPRNDMPAAAYGSVNPQGMAPFPDSTQLAMDVDAPRNKYTPSAPPGSYKSSYDSPGPRQMPDEHRSRSSSRRSRNNNYPRPTGATNAPNATPAGHFGAPPSHYKDPLANSTPPDAVQPSFPPPAVTADSPQPSEASKRRPAYLLHRDLVIGKGSYGQVCIASRGEPEGHSSGRSGKRKKFACKCVMLRNDPKYIAKLQEEVNVLRELRGHDNVIRLYDVFCVDNELFIITELGRGGDLFHLLTTHPKHGVTEAYAGTLFPTTNT